MPVEPPEQLSPIIGDCVNNLRSALDQAVSAVARQVGMPDNKTYFPTFEDAAKWNHFQRQFSSLGPNALTVIDGSQPYQHPDPDYNLLYVLNTLWNRDKHRDIILTGTCLTGVRHQHTPAGIIPMMTLGVIRDGDVVLRLPLAGTDDFKSDFLFAVAFGDGSLAPIAGGSVTNILGMIFTYITDYVLPGFEGLFQ
jgi:hypothetical protein